MNKRSKLILIVMLAVMIVFGTTSTAFAWGETLYHSGTSRYNYVSTNSVPQQYDNWLCPQPGLVQDPVYQDSYGLDISMQCCAVVANGSWQQVSSSLYAFDGTSMYIPDSINGVRDVHVKIINYPNVYNGVSVHTACTWRLCI